jgi:hypothetical protein
MSGGAGTVRIRIHAVAIYAIAGTILECDVSCPVVAAVVPCNDQCAGLQPGTKIIWVGAEFENQALCSRKSE